MTYAEIKIAALKLMYATYNELVAANIADYYEDSTINSYLFGMNESINRCFDRILEDKIAPEVIVELDDYTTTTDDDYLYTTMDLTQITDFYKLDRVIYTYKNFYDGNCEFLIEGDDLRLPYKENGTYKLVYTKTMPYIDDTITDQDTVDLPPALLRLIPYYIKGELFEEDDANLAAASMNVFEARLMTIKKNKTQNQTKVADVYGQGYYD
jgi:hypothetical protein